MHNDGVNSRLAANSNPGRRVLYFSSLVTLSHCDTSCNALSYYPISSASTKKAITLDYCLYAGDMSNEI